MAEELGVDWLESAINTAWLDMQLQLHNKPVENANCQYV
jgi:hypothetical protein